MQTTDRCVIVDDSGSDADRGAALLAAYAAAESPTDGSRLVLLLHPGVYDLGTNGLHLTKARVDIEGMGYNRAKTIITAAITTPYNPETSPVAGTITQNVGDVRISNLTVRNTGSGSNIRTHSDTDPAAYFQVLGDANLTVVKNVAFEVTNDHSSNYPWTMRVYAALNGRFEDVHGGTDAFNNSGGTLTATNCTGGNCAFYNYDGTMTATNCTGGNYAFRNDNNTMTASNCVGGDDAFHNYVGTMTAADCTGGHNAFHNNNGALKATGCTGGNYAFYNESGTITATNCAGGYGAFHNDGGTLTATKCVGGHKAFNNSVGTMNATGCIGGNDAFYNYNGTMTATGCTVGNDAYYNEGTMTAYYRRLTTGSVPTGSTQRLCIDGSGNVINQDPA